MSDILKSDELLYKTFLERRWWLVLIIVISISTFEIIEHQEEIPPLNTTFLLELFFLGLFLPVLFGMVLQSLAHSEHKRTQINQRQQLVEKLTRQMLSIDQWDELNELIVRFPQKVAPVVASKLLYNFGSNPETFKTVNEWRHKDYPITSYPKAVAVLLNAFGSSHDVYAISASQYPGLILPKGCHGICLPVTLNGKFAALLHLYLPKTIDLTPDELQIFRSITPVITFAIGNLAQQQLGYHEPISAADRSRIARNLHDTVGQNLGFLLMKLDELRRNSSNGVINIKFDLDAMYTVANEAYEQVRDTLSTLKPSSTQELATSLYQTAVFVTKNQPDISIHMSSEGSASPLPPELLQQILSIFREASINVVKHANATQLEIHIKWSDETLQVILKDNGQGMIMNNENQNSHGLRIIFEEAAEINAKLSVQSQIDLGTKIMLVLPLAAIH